MTLIKLITPLADHMPGDDEFYEHTRLRRELEQAGAMVDNVPDLEAAMSGASCTILTFGTSFEPAALNVGVSDRLSPGNIILLGSRQPPTVFSTLEQFSLAGAIDLLKYSTWLGRPERDNGYGIIGRRDVVARIGGTPAPSFGSERYTVYRSASAQTMPAALVEYAAALAEM